MMIRAYTAIAPLAALALGLGFSAMPARAAAPAPTILPVPLQPVVDPALRQCANRTASGLGTTVLRAAPADAQPGKPTKDDYVLVGYIGYIAATGKVFDQNARVPFGVEGVIPGFAEGIKLMDRGSVWRFCIPAALGYGAKGAGTDIPANADLVFQVELFDFKNAAEIERMRAEATANGTAIDPNQPQPAQPQPEAPKP